MDATNDEIDHELLPFVRVYKDGRVERLKGTDFAPPSIDSQAAVLSKDVTIRAETGLSARLYIPRAINKGKKLALLIYIHGGGFLIESAFSPLYHNYLNSVVEEANAVVVSVEYRLAPEHPVPIAYTDSWEAIQWVFSHAKGEGDETWLRDFADFDKVFLGGDSAGGNIVHNIAMQAGEDKSKNSPKFLGIILVQPYFSGKEPIGSEKSNPERKEFMDKVWTYVCPSSPGHDDPRINPVAVGAPSLSNLGCSRVLVFTAEKDIIRDRGLLYYESLEKSGWVGVADILETEGEDHVFHLFNPSCAKAITMMKNLASFLN